jgi:hypothetical protein
MESGCLMDASLSLLSRAAEPSRRLVKLSSPRDGPCGRRRCLDQFCGARVADQRTFVRDQTEPDVKADAEVLIGEACDDPVATQAPAGRLDAAVVVAHRRNVTGHRGILFDSGRRPSYRYIYWYISDAARRTGEEQKDPPAARDKTADKARL